MKTLSKEHFLVFPYCVTVRKGDFLKYYLFSNLLTANAWYHFHLDLAKKYKLWYGVMVKLERSAAVVLDESTDYTVNFSGNRIKTIYYAKTTA